MNKYVNAMCINIMNLYNILFNGISKGILNGLNEMGLRVDSRTIDRKLWLTVASAISRNRSTEAEFIKPIGKMTKDELLNRYVAALLIIKKPCPTTVLDIETLKTFKLLGLKAIEMGATILNILEIYVANGGTVEHSEDSSNTNAKDNILDTENAISDDASTDKPEKYVATPELMKEMYVKFNEMYFDNELPDVENVGFYVEHIDDSYNTHGEFKIDTVYFLSNLTKNGKYYMYAKRRYQGKRMNKRSGRMEDTYTVDTDSLVKNILDLHPRIIMSKDIVYDNINDMEDTFIHEMVHFWTYKDALLPKLGHGTEFKYKCSIIRSRAKRLYNKSYVLDTYVSSDEIERTNLTDDAMAKHQQRIQNKAKAGVYMVYIRTLPRYNKYGRMSNRSERFLFCNLKNLSVVLSIIKKSEKDKLQTLRISANCYEAIVKKYGDFPLIRPTANMIEHSRYSYYNIDDYPEALAIFNNQEAEDVLNELLKPYITPEIKVCGEITSDMNLSIVNPQDIIDNLEFIEKSKLNINNLHYSDE